MPGGTQMVFSEPSIPYFQSTLNILATPETNCLSSEGDIHKGNKSDEGCEEGAVQDWWGGVIRPLQIILSTQGTLLIDANPNDKILVKICRNFSKFRQNQSRNVQNQSKMLKSYKNFKNRSKNV